MRNFIEDYLNNPSQAVASAADSLTHMDRFDNMDEDMIYRQIASPEFRLYEEIIFCMAADDLHLADSLRPVA